MAEDLFQTIISALSDYGDPPTEWATIFVEATYRDNYASFNYYYSKAASDEKKRFDISFDGHNSVEYALGELRKDMENTIYTWCKAQIKLKKFGKLHIFYCYEK